MSTASIVRAVLVVGAWIVALVVVGRASTALVWFAEAALVAALARPLVGRLGRHVPEGVAVVVVTVAFAVVVLGVGGLVFRELQDQASELPAAAARAGNQLELSDEFGELATHLELRQEIQAIAADVADRFEIRDDELTGLAQRVGSNAAAVLAVWILAVMLILGGRSLLDGALAAVDERHRDRVREVVERAYARSCRYLGAMALRSVAAGLLAWVVAVVLDLPVPVVLGVWVALWAFVPDVGLVVGGAAVALLAAPDDVTLAVALLAGWMVLAALDARYVQRRIDDRSLRLGVFLTLTAALVGFRLYGAGGTVLAVVATQFVVSVLTDLGREAPPAPA